MFKNKRIVALVLFAVMVLVPFANAFAAVPEEDHIAALVTEVANVTTEAGNIGPGAGEDTFIAAMKQYATDGDGDAYNTAKEDWEDLLKDYENALKAANKKKATADLFTFEEYAELAAYADADAAEADYKDAIDDLKDAAKAVADAKAKVEANKDYEAIGKLVQAMNEAGDNVDAAKDVLDDFASYYDGVNKDIQELAKPYLVKVYKKWAGLVSDATAREYLALSSTPDSVKKALEGALDNEAVELTAKDEAGRVWKVAAPKSAPDALNGAVKMELRKGKNGGVKIALLDKDGKEVASKGYVDVFFPLKEGEKVTKVTIGGMTWTERMYTEDGKYFVMRLEIAK